MHKHIPDDPSPPMLTPCIIKALEIGHNKLGRLWAKYRELSVKYATISALPAYYLRFFKINGRCVGDKERIRESVFAIA